MHKRIRIHNKKYFRSRYFYSANVNYLSETFINFVNPCSYGLCVYHGLSIISYSVLGKHDNTVAHITQKRINMHSSVMFMSFIARKGDELYLQYMYIIRYPCLRVMSDGQHRCCLWYVQNGNKINVDNSGKEMSNCARYKSDQSWLSWRHQVLFQNAAACADNAAYSWRWPWVSASCPWPP